MSELRHESASGQLDWIESRTVFRAGGVSASLLIAYCIETIVQITVLGGPPATATEAFKALQQNTTVGLLRLDLVTVLAMPLYYVLFFALFGALRRVAPARAAVSAGLTFVGVSLLLSAPTALPMWSLAQKYAAATTDAARMQFLAAGEATLACDIWHGTGAILGGIFVQCAGVLISTSMLRSGVFSRSTAYLGIVMHGLDLMHILGGFVVPAAGTVLMAAAGPLYPIWFFLVGRRLLQLHACTGDA